MHWKILNWFTNHEKLLLNYLMIILQLHLRLNSKQKNIIGKRIPSMSVHVACSCVAMVSDHSNFKILSPKQMLRKITNSNCTSKGR